MLAVFAWISLYILIRSSFNRSFNSLSYRKSSTHRDSAIPKKTAKNSMPPLVKIVFISVQFI